MTSEFRFQSAIVRCWIWQKLLKSIEHRIEGIVTYAAATAATTDAVHAPGATAAAAFAMAIAVDNNFQGRSHERVV